MNKNAQIIIDIVLNSREHLTAEEIYFEAKKVAPNMVMATVYNNLNRLVDENKIRRIKDNGKKDRYDNLIRHDHMQCVKCGKISDFFYDDLLDKLRDISGENIISYDLKLNYICKECRDK